MAEVNASAINRYDKMKGIIRYCKLDEELTGENVFNCARPSILSNPYTHIRHKQTLAAVVVGSREEAISLYEPYFNAALSGNDDFSNEFRKEFERMCDAYKKYGTIYLGCYCKTTEACHCDIIRKKIMAKIIKDKLSNLSSA